MRTNREIREAAKLYSPSPITSCYQKYNDISCMWKTNRLDIVL